MAQPWSGVVLSSARLEPRQDIIFRLITLNYAAAPVRKIDERTVEYSEDPIDHHEYGWPMPMIHGCDLSTQVSISDGSKSWEPSRSHS